MQRPIEKFGWEKKFTKQETYGRNRGLVSFFMKSNDILFETPFGVTFEELQAIYETALEIKRETEMENKILCNRCENTCYYGFIQCDNFKERKKENEKETKKCC